MLLPVDPLIRFRLFGMRLGVRVSCLVALALVTGGVLARIDGGLDDRGSQVVWGIATAVCCAVLLLALIAHEAIRHQAAWRLGVTERGTDLFLFGGSPEVIDDTATPRTEALIGIAGFLAMASIAIACLLLALATPASTVALHLPAKMLALAAGALAIVQVSPALPLDGGRVFRAFVWYLTDNPAAGIKAAALYAQLLAGALIAGGFILIGATGTLPFWGAGAAVVGLQLGGAARASVHRSSWQRASRSLTVREVLPVVTPSLPAGTIVDDAVEQLLHEGMATPLLVTGPNGDPRGVLRMANLRRARRVDWPDRTVAEIMTPLAELPQLSDDLTVFDAVAQMDDAHQPFALVEAANGAIAPVSREQLIHRLFDRPRR